MSQYGDPLIYQMTALYIGNIDLIVIIDDIQNDEFLSIVFRFFSDVR